ncbi:MAG: retron system putative HNH endonuclease [Culicoidibacterales bacterium]
MKTHRNQSFSELPANVKKDLKASLLIEQHYLCAYCMQKITYEKMKVEHYLPQSEYPQEIFNYKNLFAVCSGNDYSEQTCDTSKGKQIIAINPLEQQQIQTVTYGASGIISSGNANYETDLQVTLNLNEAQLSSNRKMIRTEKIRRYQQFQGKQNFFRKIEIMQAELQAESQYESYLGVKLAIFDRILSKK